jgi:hypothetical protein
MLMPYARATTLPVESRLAASFKDADLSDAFAIALPPSASRDVVELGKAVFNNPPAVVAPLMGIRDAIMGRFGVKTAADIGRAAAGRPLGAIGPFGVEEISSREVVMGEDDRHLNFKTSFLVRQTAEGRELVWTTVVRCNNKLGRIYLAAIAPVHRRLLPAFLNLTARKGWPTEMRASDFADCLQ